MIRPLVIALPVLSFVACASTVPTTHGKFTTMSAAQVGGLPAVSAQGAPGGLYTLQPAELVSKRVTLPTTASLIARFPVYRHIVTIDEPQGRLSSPVMLSLALSRSFRLGVR